MVLRNGMGARAVGTMLLVAVGLSLGGCDRAVDVTAKPGEAADQDVVEAEPAEILVAEPVDLGPADAEIDKQLPSDVAFVARRIVRAQCSSVAGKQVCADLRLSGHITRDGQVHFAGSGRGLELAIPLRYELVGQPYGAGSNVPIAGKLTATASFSFSLDEHWHVSLKLDSGYRWDEAAKLKLGIAETSLQADVEPYLSQHLSKLSLAATSGLVPPQLKRDVEVVWRFLHYPIAVSQEQQIWLRGRPLGIRYGGIAEVDGVPELRMAVTARLQTFVGQRPAPLPPSPLAPPGSGPEPAASGGILIPAEVPYEAIATSAARHLPAIPLREVAGEPMAPATQVRSLAFYASGRRLGVAVHFASLPGGSWFSGHAVAYFLASPAVQSGTSEIVLNQAELYSPNLRQSAVLKEMPFLTDSRFAENIDGSVALDVAGALAAATDLIRQHADVPLSEGLKLRISPGRARVARLSPGLETLRLQIEVPGELTVRHDGADVASESPDVAKATR